MTLKDRLRRTLSGTLFERPARSAIQIIRRKARVELDSLNERYDHWTHQIMRRVLTPDSNCVDAGAHQGAMLQHIVELAPRGTHYAFEPLPALAANLRAQFPKVHVRQTALADRPGIASFRHVLSESAYSGFQRRPFDTYEEDVELIRVKLERLDDILDPDFPVHFIKVDVEGGENDVFRGALRTLQRCRPYVAFELSFAPEQAYALLAEEAGLRLSLLDAWLQGKQALERASFIDEWRSGRNYFFLAHPE